MIKYKDFYYYHIPKTAGLTIKRTIEKKYKNSILYSYLSHNFNHEPLWWWIEYLNIQNNPIVITVRNPYTRIISLYNHINKAKIIDENFENFIFNIEKYNYILKQYLWKFHWKQVDFIKYYENKVLYFKIEKDKKKISEIFDIDFENIKENKNEYNVEYFKKIIENDNKIKEFLFKKYKEDFVLFGYDKEEFD